MGNDPLVNTILVKLRNDIVDAYNMSELKDLCFALNVEYDNLAGEETVIDKARELVKLMERHGRITELQKEVRINRPYKFPSEAQEAKERLDYQLDSEAIDEILKMMFLSTRADIEVPKEETNLYYEPRMRSRRNKYILFTQWDMEDTVKDIFLSHGEAWAGASLNMKLEPFLAYSEAANFIDKELAAEIRDYYTYTTPYLKFPIPDLEFAKIQYLAFSIMAKLEKIREAKEA